MAQNEQRKARKLAMPVLAVGGEKSYGDHVGHAMDGLAEDVKGVVIDGAGHWVAEEAPEQVLGVLVGFLAGYREGVRVGVAG